MGDMDSIYKPLDDVDTDGATIGSHWLLATLGRGSSPFTAGGINTCGQQWIQKLLSHQNRISLFKALQIRI